MVLMNNFEEPTALLPETLRFWNAHVFLFIVLTVPIAVAYFANWLISHSISNYEESSQERTDDEVVKPEVDLKEGGEKLANFLSRMKTRELQTPPTERSFKAEIERAKVRKIRNSGVIVESPKSAKSDSFISPISAEGTFRRCNFASPQQNTIIEGTNGETEEKDVSSLRLPLEKSDEEDELNIASSPEKIIVFSDCLTGDEPARQFTNAEDHLSGNPNFGRRQISAMPAQRRIEQWINEAAEAGYSQQEAMRSAAETNVTPSRGGAFLPQNFITPSARAYHRKRVTPGYDMQKQSLSKKANHSPTGDQKVLTARMYPNTLLNGGCFSASISNALVSKQQRTTENAVKCDVGNAAAALTKVLPRQQAEPDDYLTFAKGLSAFHAPLDSQTTSNVQDKHLADGHPTGIFQPISQPAEHPLNRGVVFDCLPGLLPIAGSNAKPRGDNRTTVRIQKNAGVGEKIVDIESHKKNQTPKRKQEQANQANSVKRRHRHRHHQIRVEDIQHRTGRLAMRKPGRRTEESLLNLFQKMPLDKQQAIIQKCSAKR